MDLIQSSKVINTELTHIGLYYRDVLDPQEAASIFNSILMCITDDLARSFKFTVCDRHDPARLFVRWEYDLSGKDHIDRTGPPPQDILLLLKRLPSGTARLVCDVEWSRRFFDMDKASREEFLRSTYWGKKGDEVQKDPPAAQPSPTQETIEEIELQPLEQDLLKLESETDYINKKRRIEICESARECIQAGYCEGIRFEVFDKDRRVLEWQFKLDASYRLIRVGDGLERVLAMSKTLKDRSLDITPLTTQKFEKLPEKERRAVMKDTSWASMFKKKWLFW